ncbi:FlgB family protein [Thalassococcus sp. BH17M4-6]|uniref:FlgB family protein n=1 Tax=Thalassococcus sp. BH17M4-6 TaxID=3413148 RepID=UPI003BE3AF4F
MFQNLDILKTAMAMARHAGFQQAQSAQNIANADTPGYRAATVIAFADLVRDRDGVTGQRATRTGHLHGRADATAVPVSLSRSAQDPNGNTVSVETEMVIAVDAKRQHDRALAIYRSGLNILRASIGRA